MTAAETPVGACSSYRAGDNVTGEFGCVDCGYGIVVSHQLPACPLCGGELWQPTAWRPFSRGARRGSLPHPPRSWSDRIDDPSPTC